MTDHAVCDVHIADVPVESITHALVAIEIASRDWLDVEQHESLTKLVLGLRAARENR